MTVSQWLPQAIVLSLAVTRFLNLVVRSAEAKERPACKVAAAVILFVSGQALLWWGGFYAAFSG